MSLAKRMLIGVIKMTKDFTEIEKEQEGHRKEYMEGYNQAMSDVRGSVNGNVKCLEESEE